VHEWRDHHREVVLTDETADLIAAGQWPVVNPESPAVTAEDLAKVIWPTPVPADWERLGWFEDPEPLPERVNPVVVVVLAGALIVTVLLLAAAFVALGGVL